MTWAERPCPPPLRLRRYTMSMRQLHRPSEIVFGANNASLLIHTRMLTAKVVHL